MSKELFPSTASATGNPRNKTALKPGFSLMGWIRLTNSGEDLTGFKGKIVNVSHQELAKHNKFDDCWMAVRGKVYNVTKYLDFHPGGAEQLMRGAGKDATSLFDEFHAWVNIESLLAKCFIGPLKNTATISDDIFMKKPTKLLFAGISPTKSPINKSIDDNSSNKNLSALSLESSKKKLSMLNETEENVPVIPRFDWIQKTSELAIFFYTKTNCNPGIIVRYTSDKNVEIYIFIAHAVDCYKFTFLKPIKWPCSVKLNCESGKIEITFIKEVAEIWTNFGTYLKEPNEITYDFFEDFKISSRNFFNHDSFSMTIRPKNSLIMVLPVGSHLNFHHVSPMENEIICQRSYTPVPNKYASTSTNLSSEDILFLIKTYSHGVFSKHLSTTEQSLKLCMKPKGALNLSRLKCCTKFAMLAGGSGITPILSVLNHLLERRENRVESLTLFYFNKTESDIWLKEELENIARNDDRFHIEHMFSESTTQPSKKLDKEIIEKINRLNDFVFICGPIGFNDLAVNLLKEANKGNLIDDSSDVHDRNAQDFWVFQ